MKKTKLVAIAFLVVVFTLGIVFVVHAVDLGIIDFGKTIGLKPDNSVAHYNRGVSDNDKGDYDRAIADENRAIRLRPDFAAAYCVRGIAYHLKGDYDEAIADFNESIRLKPDYAEAYNNRGIAEALKDDYGKGIADLRESIRLKPDYANAYSNLAWLLAVCPDPHVRNGAKAVEYATRACELSEWKIPSYLDTLAAAYAEVGDFDDAVKFENKSLASNASYANLERMSQRLGLYEQNKPYHEEKP